MTTNNKIQNLNHFCRLGAVDAESFEAYVMDESNSDSIILTDIYQTTMPDLFQSAKETLALLIQADGLTREYALKLAQTGLYEMALVKIDLAKVALVDVFLAATHRPQLFLAEWNALILEGEILATPID